MIVKTIRHESGETEVQYWKYSVWQDFYENILDSYIVKQMIEFGRQPVLEGTIDSGSLVLYSRDDTKHLTQTWESE